MPTVPSDIEIAQSSNLRPIVDVAAELGLAPDRSHVRPLTRRNHTRCNARPAKGRFGARDGDQSDRAGEGKTTTTVGLTQALRKIGTNASLCIREPSLGPVLA